MTDLETWLLGNAEKITDIEFICRLIIFIVIVQLFAAIASDVVSIGKR